jgi:Kef-type K+ transport system membrane component KefB
MAHPDFLLASLAWPFAITLAWLAGEIGQRATGLPKLSFYGLVGFALAQGQLGILPATNDGPALLAADVAFGLILFELGYRINLRWLRTNGWIGVTGLAEALATFAAVYAIARAFGVETITALMLAALSMATSPATVMRVVNEQRSSGQVTERVLHFSALNCVLAVFAFNVVVGYWIFDASGNLADAATASLVSVLSAAAAGALAGMVMPALLRRLDSGAQDATLAFALSVILLVSFTSAAGISPMVAALGFGLVARHRRVDFNRAQRNFGALGELLTVLLFVFAASRLEWRGLGEGLVLALTLVGARLLTKTAGVALFSHVSGISWHKGALTGFALAPLSIFMILLLEHARQAGVTVAEPLRALAAVTMLIEVFGPIVTKRALVWAREAPLVQEVRDAA